MDKQDWTAEQQVWQRVHASREEAPRNDLRQLQREAMELAAVYRSLSSRLTGKQQEQAKRLYAGEKANAAALAGVCVLSRNGGETIKIWHPGNEEPKKVLERCYHRSRRCMAEYLSRSAEGEFGIVFEKMAKREGEHCAVIAEVLGSLKSGDAAAKGASQ